VYLYIMKKREYHYCTIASLIEPYCNLKIKLKYSNHEIYPCIRVLAVTDNHSPHTLLRGNLKGLVKIFEQPFTEGGETDRWKPITTVCDVRTSVSVS